MRMVAALVAALAALGVVFALWPGLDLAPTRWIFRHGGFWEGNAAARHARDVLRLAPFWLLGAMVVLTLARRLGAPIFCAPGARALAFLIASLTLGSGLIVNLGLKDHSHRPRPVHVAEFGGQQEFRPWYRFDGACAKNCAFASGEAASGFWLVAPALLAVPPYRAAAVVAALAYGVATSALRVAFGGHFLSDVLAGGLISLIAVFALRALMRPRAGP